MMESVLVISKIALSAERLKGQLWPLLSMSYYTVGTVTYLIPIYGRP